MSKIFSKISLVLSLALMVSLLGVASLPAKAADETLKLGFGGALLGNNASYGLSNLYGIEYAIGKINAKGGVLGRQVELVQEDDGCDPEKGSTAATKLTSLGLNLVLGHTCSGATHSALSVYGDSALVISSSATEVSLTESGDNPYFFRTTPRDDAQVPAQVDYIVKKGFKRVAILHDKGDYGLALAEMARNLLNGLKDKPDGPKDIEIVLFDGITTGDPNFDDTITLVASKQADILIWGGYYSDASKLVVQMRDKGVATLLIGPDGLYNNSFITLAGAAAEGVLTTGQMDLSNSDAAKAAIEDHKTRHSEDIGPYFFYSAGATEALLAAVEKVGNTTDLEAIKKHLNEDTVDTIMGPVRFDAKGDVIGVGFSIYEIKDGTFHEIKL
ncbi:MAG: branched-chain amino acid ABC transporter substrate-binding protein [Deltaproteobacteria bacterium]|jgi:branched-chain amino acid transport system substrate-binding protein|nr:branched-chain amino acid ABC transporter substrate-binding protein [Deltaproteobacteria bacterium]